MNAPKNPFSVGLQSDMKTIQIEENVSVLTTEQAAILVKHLIDNILAAKNGQEFLDEIGVGKAAPAPAKK